MRLLSIPAMLIGIAVAIIFFKIYGVFTRPAVPMPVAVVVSKFAPGVEIGARVSDARRAVAAMSYVPHLGFEVANGGRYDGLPAAFGQDLPAVGFSFSLDRLEQIATPKLEVPDSEPISVNGAGGFEQAVGLRGAGKAVKLCL